MVICASLVTIAESFSELSELVMVRSDSLRERSDSPVIRPRLEMSQSTRGLPSRSEGPVLIAEIEALPPNDISRARGI